MESKQKQTLWSFMDEERKKITLPRKLSFGNHECDSHSLASARTSSASATSSVPLGPMSPETPWRLSPVRRSPSPSLVYHCLASLHRHDAGNIFSITVLRDVIFTGSESRRIHAWKQPDCTEMGSIKANAGEVRAILAHGRLLFTTHGDRKIRVWDVSSMQSFRPKKITTLPRRNSFFLYPRKDPHLHTNIISCIAFNNYEGLLYTGSWDKTVKAWKVSERKCIDSFVAHDGVVNAIVINQLDGCVFTCSSDGTVKLWRRVFAENTHILSMTLKFQLSPVNALALSSSLSGCLLYSGSADGLINYWEKERMSSRFNHRGFLQGHRFSVLCLVATGDLVFSGSEDATIRVWRREEGNAFHSCIAVMDGHHGPVRCLAASFETEGAAMGLLVYSASFNRTLKVWRLNVYPTEVVSQKTSAAKNEQSEIAECPVLSPSWVERKMQGSYF